MLLTDKTTFTEFLIEARRSHPEARGDLNGVLHSVATACKAISRAVAHGSLADLLGNAEASNVHGERQKKLDVVANDRNGEQILHSLKSGDYFGEGARPKIDCCIRARTRVRLLAIDTQVAEALSAVRPDAAMLLKQGKNGNAAGRTV